MGTRHLAAQNPGPGPNPNTNKSVPIGLVAPLWLDSPYERTKLMLDLKRHQTKQGHFFIECDIQTCGHHQKGRQWVP